MKLTEIDMASFVYRIEEVNFVWI